MANEDIKARVAKLAKQANQRIYRLEKFNQEHGIDDKNTAYYYWKQKSGRNFGLTRELNDVDPAQERRNYMDELVLINNFLDFDTSSVAGYKRNVVRLADTLGYGKLTFEKAKDLTSEFFEIEKTMKDAMDATPNLKYIEFNSDDNQAWGVIKEMMKDNVKNDFNSIQSYLVEHYSVGR